MSPSVPWPLGSILYIGRFRIQGVCHVGRVWFGCANTSKFLQFAFFLFFLMFFDFFLSFHSKT